MTKRTHETENPTREQKETQAHTTHPSGQEYDTQNTKKNQLLDMQNHTMQTPECKT